MYSLGIIFFELFHPFKTYMERVEDIKNLKDGLMTADMIKFEKQVSEFILLEFENIFLINLNILRSQKLLGHCY